MRKNGRGRAAGCAGNEFLRPAEDQIGMRRKMRGKAVLLYIHIYIWGKHGGKAVVLL